MGGANQKKENYMTDSVTILTKEGFELRHEVFLHDAPAPEPVEEVVEEQV